VVTFCSYFPCGLKSSSPVDRADRLRSLLILPLAAVLFLYPPSAPAQTKSSSTSFATLSKRAAEARDADRLQEAVGLYTKALALHPRWAEGWWSLGTLQYDQDHFAKAALDFQKLLALQPENGGAHAMLGLCEFELGRDQQALQHLEKGKSIGLPQEAGLWNVVLYHEGILLQRGGRFGAAQETLEDLCLRGSQTDEVANLLGMTLLRLTSKNPPPRGSADADIVVRVGRAECLAGQKKYDEARLAFEEAVKENPSFPNIHYAYGLSLLELRDVAGSVEQFKQEIANHPDNVLSRLRIASILYKQDSAAGIPYAEEAVKLDPQLGFAHYLLGLLLLDTGSSEKALPELELAQKSFPREARLYFALGSVYSHAGRKQDAARARAIFERLAKQGENSTSVGDEIGFHGALQEKMGKEEGARPPQ
jgi:tetratricopeptide (TPR) repeat protein